MASPSNALSAPPSMDDSAQPQQTPSSPTAASPSPAQPSPAMQQGTQDVIEIVNKLRGIAKAHPKVAPQVSQINDLMREVLSGMMESQTPGEPQAPPVGG
jgi:hypothetical protein